MITRYQKGLVPLLPFFLLFFFLTFLVRENAFFWDTIQLASLHAHWFLDSNFSTISLPESMDSGHFPAMGIYLAFLWKILGKSLTVSHFSLLPFLFGLVWATHRLCIHYLGDKNAIWGMLLIFLDPVLLGQSVLVSPDIVLLFFFMLAWLAIIRKSHLILSFAVLGLAMISLRGMMAVMFLYIFSLLIDAGFRNLKGLIFLAIIKAWPFVPAGLFSLIFLLYHQQQTGWIGYHAGSPWAPAFEKVNLTSFIRNIGILGWRFIDFGRVFLWLGLFYALMKMNRNHFISDEKGKQLLLFFLLSLLVLCPSLLVHKNILGHRYLLPCFVAFTMFFSYLVCNNQRIYQAKKYVSGIGLIGLISGNLWVYPKSVAQGWDSTLAHLPYYELRKEMIDYIDSEKLNYQSIGSTFPNLRTFKHTDLNEREEAFTEKDMDTNQYIFYANVFNDFTDEELEALKNDWTILKALHSWPVCVILYQKK